MVIGERKIRGILREKEEAEAIYAEALEHGYRASLLVQRRPNVFEQRVANIEPGKAIDVDIAYFHTLAYNDGWYSFVFPTVVGPRFSLPGSEDPLPAMRRQSDTETPGARGVRYLSPTERSGHDLSIKVRIDAGVVDRGTQIDPRHRHRAGGQHGSDRAARGPDDHSEPRLCARLPGRGRADQIEPDDLPGSRFRRGIPVADGDPANRYEPP